MSTQVFINLDDLIHRAYNLGLNAEVGSEPLTKLQLRTILLTEVPVSKTDRLVEEVSTTTKPKATKTKTKAITTPEKKTRAPAKPRAIPEDDTRCCARAFYEKDHLENGKLKVMREDSSNLFGDRCKFKKTSDEFCKHHAEKQPHGVWGGDYDGKFKQYKISESDSSTETPEPVETKPTPITKKKTGINKTKTKPPFKPKVEKEDEVEADDSSSIQSDDSFYDEESKKIPQDVELIEIDEIDYYIDTDGNTYDPESEEKVGVYDKKKKSWVVEPRH